MRNAVRCILFLLPLAFGGGCAATHPGLPSSGPGVVWPELPAPARIEFVGEYRQASDFGIRPGFWGSIANLLAGGADDSMVRPMAVAATDDGDIIFVADPDAGCVHRYDLRRGRYACLMLGKDEALVSPVGLAVTSDGHLFISDSQLGGIFQVYPGTDRIVPLDVKVPLIQPTGIAWDRASRMVFVTDTGAQAVKSFTRDGTLVMEFGHRGTAAGELNYPTYLWIDDPDYLLVTDSLNFRIQRYDLDGAFVQAFGEHGDLPGNLARPKGVAVDSLGHIYVMDGMHHSMQIFDRMGQLLLAIGEQGQQPGQFWLPNGLFITGTNVIYVADSYNRRIQVFRYIGPDV